MLSVCQPVQKFCKHGFVGEGYGQNIENNKTALQISLYIFFSLLDKCYSYEHHILCHLKAEKFNTVSYAKFRLKVSSFFVI